MKLRCLVMSALNLRRVFLSFPSLLAPTHMLAIHLIQVLQIILIACI